MAATTLRVYLAGGVTITAGAGAFASVVVEHPSASAAATQPAIISLRIWRSPGSVEASKVATATLKHKRVASKQPPNQGLGQANPQARPQGLRRKGGPVNAAICSKSVFWAGVGLQAPFSQQVMQERFHGAQHRLDALQVRLVGRHGPPQPLTVKTPGHAATAATSVAGRRE